MDNPVDIAEVERLLGLHPEFGDVAAIERGNIARLKTGLALLAELSNQPVAGLRAAAAATDADLTAMLHDPVLRNAFETDLQAAASGSLSSGSLLARFLPGTAGYAPSRGTAGSEHGAWPGCGDARVWLSVREGESDPFAQRLGQMLEACGIQSLVEPNVEQMGVIRHAAELLVELLPTLGPGILRHIGLVGLTRGRSADGVLHSLAGGDPFPAAIFVAPERLANVWEAAGVLLHEGLHLHLFEVARCGALTRRHVDVAAEVVIIPWRVQKWTLMRVLFALHVYVHLSLFQQAAAMAPAALLDRYGYPSPAGVLSKSTLQAEQFSSPIKRARYLASEMDNYLYLMTPRGRRLVAWIKEALGVLNRGEPATGYQAIVAASRTYLAEQQQLVLGFVHPARMLWLNLSAWLIYSLCDGRDSQVIRRDYVDAVAAIVPEPDATMQFEAGIRELLRQGVVIPVTPTNGGMTTTLRSHRTMKPRNQGEKELS